MLRGTEDDHANDVIHVSPRAICYSPTKDREQSHKCGINVGMLTEMSYAVSSMLFLFRIIKANPGTIIYFHSVDSFFIGLGLIGH